jgi:hypothetical protein
MYRIAATAGQGSKSIRSGQGFVRGTVFFVDKSRGMHEKGGNVSMEEKDELCVAQSQKVNTCLGSSCIPALVLGRAIARGQIHPLLSVPRIEI